MQIVKPVITFISLIPREGKSHRDSAYHMQVSSKLCDKQEGKRAGPKALQQPWGSSRSEHRPTMQNSSLGQTWGNSTSLEHMDRHLYKSWLAEKCDVKHPKICWFVKVWESRSLWSRKCPDLRAGEPQNAWPWFHGGRREDPGRLNASPEVPPSAVGETSLQHCFLL